jgi:hypothetical protein
VYRKGGVRCYLSEAVNYKVSFNFKNNEKNVIINFRLISKDLLTMENMYKCKMVENDKFKRSDDIDTDRPLLW